MRVFIYVSIYLLFTINCQNLSGEAATEHFKTTDHLHPKASTIDTGYAGTIDKLKQYTSYDNPIENSMITEPAMPGISRPKETMKLPEEQIEKRLSDLPSTIVQFVASGIRAIIDSPFLMFLCLLGAITYLSSKATEVQKPKIGQGDIATLLKTIQRLHEAQNKMVSRIELIEQSSHQIVQNRNDDSHANDIKKALESLRLEVLQLKSKSQNGGSKPNKRSYLFSVDTTPNIGEDLYISEQREKAPEVAEVPVPRVAESSGQQMINLCKPLDSRKIPSVSVSPEKQRSLSPTKQFSIPHPRARNRPKPAKIVEEQEGDVDTNVVTVNNDRQYPDLAVELPVDRPEERSDIDDEKAYAAEDENPFALLKKQRGAKEISPKLASHRMSLFNPQSLCDVINTDNTPERPHVK